MSSGILTNWARNFTFEAGAIHHPTSTEEVQRLVATLPRVKAVGTMHSFSPVADAPGGALISLARVAPDVTIDQEAMTATFTAGTSYGAIAVELESRGYALHNMGSLPHISVGGAIATGTHGSGDANGILSTAVAGVELVVADGSVVSIDRSSTDLAALAVGLGAFGIVTRVTLDIRPTYMLRQDLYSGATWDEVLAALDDVMAGAYSVSLMAKFAGPTIASLWHKAVVEPDFDPAEVADALYGGTRVRDGALGEGSNLNPLGGKPGPWSERLPHFRLDSEPSAGGDELQSEYFVDRRHGAAALHALRGMGDRIAPHLWMSEIRTTAADDLWMSPAYRRPSLCIGFTWRKHPAEVEALLADIEAALDPFEPRPHWGKLFALRGVDFLHRLPRLSDFMDLAGQYDPSGKFSNPFVRRLGAET